MRLLEGLEINIEGFGYTKAISITATKYERDKILKAFEEMLDEFIKDVDMYNKAAR